MGDAETAQPWQFWQIGEVLRHKAGIQPRLASWNRKGDPEQEKLAAYLRCLADALEVSTLPDSGLALDLEVGGIEKATLLQGCDLENYLTPIVDHLGNARFVFASAVKRVGGGSCVTVAKAEPAATAPGPPDWDERSFPMPGGTQRPEWKAGLKQALFESGVQTLPDGAVEVQLAWSGAATRNWVWLWKPTGDAMGHVLGVPDPAHPYHVRDDRITRLALHWNPVASAGHEVTVGMWWRATC